MARLMPSRASENDCTRGVRSIQSETQTRPAPRSVRTPMASTTVRAFATAHAAGVCPRARRARARSTRPARVPTPIVLVGGGPTLRSAPIFVGNNTRGLTLAVAASDGDGDETLDVDAVMKEITDTSELGQRDEVFFVGQMVLILLVAFPPFQLDVGDAKFGDPLFGIATIALATVLLVQGTKNLGNSLTPFPKPRADNVLKTQGAYAVVRHPMYSGLIFGCFGTALATDDPTRTLFTMALAALLNAKAGKEETYLEAMHGADVYGAYAKDVPRLIPRIDGMKTLLDDFGKNFEKQAKDD